MGLGLLLKTFSGLVLRFSGKRVNGEKNPPPPPPDSPQVDSCLGGRDWRNLWPVSAHTAFLKSESGLEQLRLASRGSVPSDDLIYVAGNILYRGPSTGQPSTWLKGPVGKMDAGPKQLW